MTIWKLGSASNDYTTLVYMNKVDAAENVFLTDGQIKHWAKRPQLQPFLEKLNQAPLADISYISPGSLVLNRRAYQTLHDFLCPFGQLLEVDFQDVGKLLGENEDKRFYFYNVTNIIACIDYVNSQKIGAGVSKEAFFANAIPQDCQIFKDPRRIRTQIYLSEVAKEKLCQLIAAEGLTGAVIEPAGQ